MPQPLHFSVEQNSRPALLQRLRKLFFNEAEKGVQDVQEKLRLWLSVLKNLDARKSKDTTVQNLEIDIRDLVCRLEDVLETSTNDVQSSSTKNKLRKLTRFLEVEKIIARVESTLEEHSNISAATNTKEEESSHSENENQGHLKYHNSHQKKDKIVGMDEEFRSLGDIMFGKVRSLKAICIYGANGIGKTTLAQKLFTINAVKFHFDCCAWVNLGQNFTRETVLRNMLNQLSGGEDITKSSDLESLYDNLYKSLKGRRYLVVFDDMWSLETWDFIHRFFPNDQNRSRLMVTTQLREVATHVAGDDRDGFIFRMRILQNFEASELFWKTALLADLNKVDPAMKQCGEKILEECKGLPSAIVAVGQLLATKHTFHEWEMVLLNTKSLLSRRLQVDQIGLNQSISALSFDDLPYHLKPCFLYLGLFPKGLKIEVEHLCLLWMAEGIIALADCQNNEATMDLAERYLNDLKERKMVEVEEDETPLRKYKSCWVHEDMQDHCLRKGEDYFFKGADSSSSISHPARRMALHLSRQDDSSAADPFRNDLVDHLRSLLLLNPHDLQRKWEWPRRISDLKNFRMLRVLTFERIDFQERGLPPGLTKLIFLRYLSFKGCILKVLPSSIGNLSFLEILDLRVTNRIIIPNVLRKMEKLRHLYLPLMFQTPTNGKLYLGGLKKLEILENFDTRVCNAADLFEMMNLRHLSTTVEGILEDLEQIVRRLDMTSKHASVFFPSIKVKNFDCYIEERHSVFRKLLNCQILHTLCMDGHLGYLPPDYKISSSLTEIVLIGSQLKEDPMTTLSKLPELQILILKDNAYIEKKMNCSASGFKQLKRLELLTLQFLEMWEVEYEAMPKLSNLTIKSCSLLKLQMITDRLKGRQITFQNDVSHGLI